MKASGTEPEHWYKKHEVYLMQITMKAVLFRERGGSIGQYTLIETTTTNCKSLKTNHLAANHLILAGKSWLFHSGNDPNGYVRQQ